MISTISNKNPPCFRRSEIRNPPLFSAKIIYENTTFAKKFRACGAKLFTKTQHLQKVSKTRGEFLYQGEFLSLFVLIVGSPVVRSVSQDK